MKKYFDVLYISYDGLLEPLGRSQIIPYIKGLSKKGIKYIILTFEKNNGYVQHYKIQKLKQELDSLGIIWKVLRYHKNPQVLSTFLDVIFGCIVGLWMVKKYKIKIVHARSYVAGLIAFILLRLFRLKFIFDLRGFWIEERVEAGLWKRNSFIYSLAKFFEKRFFVYSNTIISLTDVGKKEIESLAYLKGHRLGISVIPTCVDLNRFKPREIDYTKGTADRNSADKPVLVYSGAISTWSLPQEMLSYFTIAKKYMPTAYFLVLTQEKELFEKILKAANLNHGSIFVVSTNYESMPDYLNRGSVGLAFYKAGYSRKGRCPTKIGEYLACGLPVIVNAGIGDIDKIVETEKVGIVVKEFSREDYERVSRDLQRLLSENDTLSKRCRLVAKQYFSLEIGIKRYLKAYHKLFRQ